SVARDILFSARFLEAEEALRVGLINSLHDDDEIEQAVSEYASTLASNAPLTMRAAKAAINEWQRDASRRDLGRVESLVNACFDSDDYREGRRAFAEKRPPEFRGK
ncbi:MAG TPA: enoyl-CoA hydratase-related protein, partial [Dehalococcoidia bacterium]|nr:enoyl-CoA hydratase-related protein [Dehalococcoidia bacterium]